MEGHARLRELKGEINTKTRNTAHTLVHNYTDRMRVINTHTFHFNTTIKRERACYSWGGAHAGDGFETDDRGARRGLRHRGLRLLAHGSWLHQPEGGVARGDVGVIATRG